MTPDLFEHSLRSAFDYAPIGMAVLTPTGIVITCNAALGELLGRAPESMVGSTLFEVTHPDELPEVQHNCHLIQTGTRRIPPSRVPVRPRRRAGRLGARQHRHGA